MSAYLDIKVFLSHLKQYSGKKLDSLPQES